ncbi:MAG: proline dehydrogenase family protein [Deltaproteobacteria bacterium]|nr:proline dehydrogenase family protein [Deltaproteobacteria bacterium]
MLEKLVHKRKETLLKGQSNHRTIEPLHQIPMNFLFIFAKRFIAGQTLGEALPVVEQLHRDGFATTLDILGESVTNPAEARNMADDYCNVIRMLREKNLDANMSLKLTQLGLDISNDLCFDNVAKILIEAGKNGGFIRVDMEGSAYTQRTLDMVKRWHNIYPNVGTVLQAMLKRTPKDVENLLEEKVGIRLCKGAYKEPHNVAFPDKRDVDRQYEILMDRLIGSGIYHGIATHDEKMINKAKEFAANYGIGKDKFEFQMLLGIRRDLQRQLLKDGWRVRIYVPYGSAWLPYTLRRIRERKENLWFVVKNIFRR